MPSPMNSESRETRSSEPTTTGAKKRRSGKSPTSRALGFCRSNGWVAQVVERRIPFTHRLLDLFGCIDLVVLDGAGGGPLGVQVTSGSNVSARLTKSREEPRLQAWLSSPARFEVWGYGKRKKRRKDGSYGKSYEWVLRRERLETATPEPKQRIDPAMWDL